MNASFIHKLAVNIDIGCNQMTDKHSNAHPFRHRDMTAKESMAKTILATNGVSDYSVFRNDDAFTACVSNAMVANAEKICKWMQHAPNGSTRDFVAMNPSVVGPQKGYIHKKGTEYGITELDCKETTIRLTKDKDADFGFYIISAWPETEHGTPSGRDLTKDIVGIPDRLMPSDQIRQQAIEESKVRPQKTVQSLPRPTISKQRKAMYDHIDALVEALERDDDDDQRTLES